MLFNSYKFIFVYLPIVFFGFFLIAPKSRRSAALWLAVASIFFYGWWNPRFVVLLLASIIFNYRAGCFIGNSGNDRRAKIALFVAVAVNLLLLGFFKYTNFFLSIAREGGAQIPVLEIVLPLGISFFTFTQIAFLVDVKRGFVREHNFIHYLLFVTWFPHLVAGPVLHHRQMMPQFGHSETYRPDDESIAVGVTLFSLGLFKKVVLADHFAVYANSVFDMAAQGGQPLFFASWVGVLAYTLQIYFDFSGYSDMAIGLSRLFNVKLPLNFNSPYKAASIIEFWRCWHMTLSAFLREYLYLPLGGNRRGASRRYINLMVTMLLGGLWHGAGWTFVIWGGLHGAYLVINHGWRNLVAGVLLFNRSWARYVGALLTFTVIVIAWVPFRATSLEAMMAIFRGMAGINGISLPEVLAPLAPMLAQSVDFSGLQLGQGSENILPWIFAGLTIVWVLPNTQQWLANYAPAWEPVTSRARIMWRPNGFFAVLTGLIFAVSVLAFKKNSPFLYFQF